MKNVIKVYIVLLVLNAYIVCAEVISVSPEHEQRFESILSELRCLVCQNQTIAESSSDLANDLRVEVKEMIEGGSTDQEILDFMSDRYGDFVLYNPPVKPRTLLLWVGPFFLMIMGVSIAIMLVRKRSQNVTSSTLTEDDKKRLHDLLDNNDKE